MIPVFIFNVLHFSVMFAIHVSAADSSPVFRLSLAIILVGSFMHFKYSVCVAYSDHVNVLDTRYADN